MVILIVFCEQYAFIIVVILLLELAGGIAGYVLRGDIEEAVKTNMDELMSKYDTQNATKDLFDNMQKEVSGTKHFLYLLGNCVCVILCNIRSVDPRTKDVHTV